MSNLPCPNCNACFLDSFMSNDSDMPVVGTVPTFLFDSSYAPSESQIECVRSVINASTARRDALDAKISGLEHILSELKDARQREVDKVKLHESILAPIRRVPQELLSLMFKFVVDTTYEYTDSPYLPEGGTSFDCRKAPLLLTGVCRSWRESAIHTPSLWSTICLAVAPSISEGSVLLLQTFLTRSCSSLLWIQIYSWNDVEVDVNLKRMYSLLSTHTQRWQNARLCVPAHQFRVGEPKLFAADYSNLKDISLLNVGDCPKDSIPFSKTPKLRSLFLTGIVDNVWPAQGMFNWPSLVELRLAGIESIQALLKVLQWCSNLKNLSVEFYIHVFDDPEDLDHVHQNQLEALTLGQFAHFNGIIFKHLKAPNLASICLVGSDYRDLASDEDIGYLTDFMKRSKCLRDISLPSEMLSAVKCALESSRLKDLISLGFRIDTWADTRTSLRFLDELMATERSNIDLPLLTELHIDLHSDYQLLNLCNKVSTLCRQVSSNMQPASIPRLQSILLEGTFEKDSSEYHAVSQLKELDSACLEVRVHSY